MLLVGWQQDDDFVSTGRKSLSPVLDSSRSLELQQTDTLHLGQNTLFNTSGRYSVLSGYMCVLTISISAVTGVLKGEAPIDSSSSAQSSSQGFAVSAYSSTGWAVQTLLRNAGPHWDWSIVCVVCRASVEPVDAFLQSCSQLQISTGTLLLYLVLSMLVFPQW